MVFETQYMESANIQLIDGDRGTNYPKQEHFKTSGHCLFLSAKNVTASGFAFGERVFIDSARDTLLRAGKLQRGDVVLTTRGTIGNVAFYSNDIPFDHIRINSGMIILRANPAVWNRRFLYFLFASNYVQEQISALTSGSAVPQLPARDLKKFRLPVVKKETQDAIEKIVGDISDKIDLNRRINDTLEAMAQAIFKSWFVDFDPVKAKIAANQEGRDPLRAAMSAISGKPDAELDALPSEQYEQLAATAALFPDEMEESELEEIPRGWVIKKFGDFVDRISVGKKFDQKTAFAEGKVPILDQGKSGIIGFHNESPGVSASLEKPVVVFANHTCYMRLITFDFSAIQNVLPFVGKDVDTVWAFYATKDKVKFSEYKGHWPDFALATAVVPESDLTRHFRRVVQPLVSQMRMLELESEQLSLLRDTLLPKLLSGELSVTEATAEVEA